MIRIVFKTSFFILFVFQTILLSAQQPNPPEQVNDLKEAKYQAYLFGHMTHQDYGCLYYSVSPHFREAPIITCIANSYSGH